MSPSKTGRRRRGSWPRSLSISCAARNGAAEPEGAGMPSMNRVLITGAAGPIGRALRESLRGVYPLLRLSDRVPLTPAGAGEEVDQTDLTDMAAVEKMVAGVDGIVHLGGISGESDWQTILAGNIVGTYNLFEAARRAGVRRIVFATSNHAVGFYPRTQRIDHRVVPRPDSRYGVSKAFGEALASLYADKHGIGFLCTRIGNFGPSAIDKRRLSARRRTGRGRPDRRALSRRHLLRRGIHGQDPAGVAMPAPAAPARSRPTGPPAPPRAGGRARPSDPRRRSGARRGSGVPPSPRSARPPTSAPHRGRPPPLPCGAAAVAPAGRAGAAVLSAERPCTGSSDIRRSPVRCPFRAATPRPCAKCGSAGCGRS